MTGFWTVAGAIRSNVARTGEFACVLMLFHVIVSLRRVGPFGEVRPGPTHDRTMGALVGT